MISSQSWLEIAPREIEKFPSNSSIILERILIKIDHAKNKISNCLEMHPTERMEQCVVGSGTVCDRDFGVK